MKGPPLQYYIFDREGRGLHILKASSLDQARTRLWVGPWEYQPIATCKTLEAANEYVFMERVKREAKVLL